MPRKLGPRHARSRHALATVNRMASAANDIARLAWHDHQTADGESPNVGPFAPNVPLGADRQVARHLAALWLFVRHLAARKVTTKMRDDALAHVDALYALDKASAKVAGREVFPEREYKAVRLALTRLGRMPRAETARAISHTLARIARWRCDWNANAGYQKNGKWAQGALWSPAATLGVKAQGRRSADERRRAEDEELAKLARQRAAPELQVLPGGGQPAAVEEEDIDPETSQSLFGLRGLRSIFAR